MKYLGAVLVLCIAGVGWAGEQDVIARLEKAEARIFYFGGMVGEAGNLMVVLDSQSADAALAELCELRRLRLVALRHPGLTNTQMRTVCGLTWLYYLDLDGCPVTDAHLKQVATLRNLTGLSLVGTRVTDVGLEELTALRDLERLWLDGTAVTDAGLRRLEGMDKLTTLYLRNCPNITDEGVARLQKALPKCDIRH
jgi:hypothetical protein